MSITSSIIVILIVCVAFLATLLVIVGLLLLFKNKQQVSQLKSIYDANENTINQWKTTIAQQENTINIQTAHFQKAQHENTSGIRYAKRIQKAAFSQNKEISGIFNEFFIFSKPHSIVTGDFYKAVEIEHYKIFALADCSGHGVPGGFLTMLGLSAFKESLQRHFYDDNIDLAAILDEMREFVKSSLRSTDDSIATINDGMNLTVCAFDIKGGGVRFAGANQNVYVYSDGQLTTYNGDRMPIGWSFKGESPFTETYIPVHKGDMLYLTTDSLQNQFGGPENTKFSTKRLVSMFEQLGTQSIEQQQATVADIVNNWVEGYEQVDDLTVAGVRI